MKMNNIGSNMCEVTTRKETILFSYNTPVALLSDGTLFVTEEKHSVTTQRHINKWIKDNRLCRSDAITKEQSYFDNLVINIEADSVSRLV